MTNDRARELLAAEFEENGNAFHASWLRSNEPLDGHTKLAVRAIERALTHPKALTGDVVERVAKVLYECERERSDHVDKLLSAAKGQPVKFRMEPWDDVADIYRSDASRVLSAMDAGEWQDIASAPKDGTVK